MRISFFLAIGGIGLLPSLASRNQFDELYVENHRGPLYGLLDR